MSRSPGVSFIGFILYQRHLARATAILTVFSVGTSSLNTLAADDKIRRRNTGTALRCNCSENRKFQLCTGRIFFARGYERGYRHSWDCATGSVSATVFTDNTKSWSGDHCVDPRLVPGVFWSNRKINTDTPRLMDMAPTVLDVFGVPAPGYMQGRSFFGDRKPAPAKAAAPQVRA